MKKYILTLIIVSCIAFPLPLASADSAREGVSVDGVQQEVQSAAAKEPAAKQAGKTKDKKESKDDNENIDEIEKARQALQYGLESEIAEVLNKIDKQDFESLQEDFVRLFQTTRSAAIREGLFALYQKYENAQLADSAAGVVEDYGTQQRTVIKAALAYLAAVKPAMNSSLREALQRLLTEETAEYGAEAITVLGAIGSEDDAAFLAEYFETFTMDDAKQELIVKQTIAAALEKIHSDNIRDFLLERLEDENENVYVRSSALAGLAQMKNADTVPLLVSFFEKPEPLLREAVMRGIAQFDTAETRALTLQAFRDSSYQVRLAALQAVQKTKQTDAVPYVLYRAKYDPTEAVRLSAVETLTKLNAPEGNTWLKETFCDTKKGEKLRVAILRAVLQEKSSLLNDDLEPVILPTITDAKQKQLRYSFGKEIAKSDSIAVLSIGKAFLQSDDALTKSIGLDMFKTNRSAELRPLVEAIAQDEKQGTLQRRAQRLLE